MTRALLIESDKRFAELIFKYLSHVVCQVKHCLTGDEGLEIMMKESFDLIIMDNRLPENDSLDVCRKLREEWITTPMIILTDKSEKVDKVEVLEVGADDYLIKPFNVLEFVARVKAILRRQAWFKKTADPTVKMLKVDSLVIDQAMRKVSQNGQRVDLTPIEYELLVLLARHPGKSFTRETLLNSIWGDKFSGYEHTVNSHVNRLRSKIESDYSKPRFILTTWAVGYRFNDELPIVKYH